MQRSMLKSKIHRATATHAELHYEGSCAIDEDLLDAANIREFEAIDIWNINNGARFSTYALKAARGSGIISVNGSAARSAQVGDLLIIATFAHYDEAEIANHQPSLVYVDSANRMVRSSNAIPTQNK
ncbi:L-aspartate 1-decarboxylase [Andreprevotia lacus DSM 23236]|jgi:aspartate 1-decarboxylase|uniref:Aspartate 1-decarboxylase n=1 Tax=Andreprevotia lacus DSM 23236 TaxID=1121001 RepID=A0A1W1X497_9NEIS|nr:aspartate 1-decarboxylase [Andreprevotia lacus]SMC18717.1 L-aspartate 1-decarboxylase [Andreprevotia lacus DSM 23236]